MKQLTPIIFLVLSATLATGCGSPATPVASTATSAPAIASATPTLNFRATEAAIIAHVFGTMTASAPTATRPLPPTPTTAAKPTATPRTARPTTASPRTTAPATPTGPKATADPVLSQIPKGMGGILVINYFGDKQVVFSIGGTQRTIDPNTRMLIILAPDHYNFSVQIPGVNRGSWSAPIDVPKDNYVPYPISLDTIP